MQVLGLYYVIYAKSCLPVFFFNLVQECRAAACLTLLKLQNSWENVCVVAPASAVCLYHTHIYIYTHIFVIHTYIYTRIECVCESVCMCVHVCVCACEREKEKGNFRERRRVYTLSYTHRVRVRIARARGIEKVLSVSHLCILGRVIRTRTLCVCESVCTLSLSLKFPFSLSVSHLCILGSVLFGNEGCLAASSAIISTMGWLRLLGSLKF